MEEEEIEIWKDIPGYEGCYQASTLGRIKSLPHTITTKRGVVRRIPGQLLRLRGAAGHHLHVSLHGKGFSVHGLVLLTFVGPRPPSMECRHFPDPNPWNNRVTNIQWGTKKENFKDRVTHGTALIGEKGTSNVLKENQVLEILDLWEQGPKGNLGTQILADRFVVSTGCIQGIVKNKTWRHLSRKPGTLINQSTKIGQGIYQIEIPILLGASEGTIKTTARAEMIRTKNLGWTYKLTAENQILVNHTSVHSTKEKILHLLQNPTCL